MSYILRWIMSPLKQILYSFISLSVFKCSKQVNIVQQTTNSSCKFICLPSMKVPKPHWGKLYSSSSKAQDNKNSPIQLPSILFLNVQDHCQYGRL